MIQNIFISGADGTRKTTTARKLADFIAEDLGRQVKWISFPTDHTFAAGAIAGHRQNRIRMPTKAITSYYAIDRLEEAEWHLAPYREKFPDVIYVFDRGPLDGKVYALDRFRDQMDKETLTWINSLDSMFERMFPVDLGFLMTSSLETSNKAISDRVGKDPDIFDKDMGWQERTRLIFDKLTIDNPIWHRIGLGPNGEEFDVIKEIVRAEIQRGSIESEANRSGPTERL